MKQGILLAESTFNNQSAIKVKAIFEDTQADPKNSISAYQNLKKKSSFPAIITYGSGAGIALSSITNNDKVIQMGVATSTPSYRTKGDYTFRNFPSADLDAEFVVNSILKTLNTTEIAILNIQNEYGVSSKNSVKKLFNSLGGKIIFEEEIDANGTDYRSTLLKLKSRSPKVVYLAVYPTEGAILLKQAKELGIKTTFIAGPAIIGSNQFIELSKNAAEGLLVAASEPTFLRKNYTSIQKFNNDYKTAYKIEPDIQQIYAARAYDAYLLLSDGIVKCSGSGEDCLKEYLFKIKNYQGVSGNLSFDENGDVSSEFELQIIKNGKFEKFLGQ